MNNITVITELCQEDRNRLDTLIAIGLELAKKNSYELQTVTPVEVCQEEPETELEGQETLEEAVPAVTGKLGDKGNEKLFSAVQQKVVKLSAAGKEEKAAVREVVQKYATKVSDIQVADYDTVMELLTALEG